MPSVLGDSLPGDSVLSGNVAPVKPAAHRELTDTKAVRTNIYNRVLGAVNKIGPLANSRHTLTLHNVDYADPEEIDLEDQKQAIMTGKSLSRRLRGTWRLTDNATNNVLDEKPLTIAQVPYYTPRGTFVLNGTEYTLSNQMRLRPGIFTRIKENGEIESHVNVMPGNGISHRYFLDPETGIFKINIGQAKLPLMPLMHALGVTNTELRKAWGDDLMSANLQVPDGKTVGKLYQRLIRRPEPGATDQNKAEALAKLFHTMKMDPEVTKRTLGNPHEFLTKDAILDTTKKLIRVSRQEEDPDDRDHLAFQTFHGPEDLLSERITKDRMFLRQLLWKASFKGNLSSMQPGALTRQLHATIMHTGLGQAAEEINSAELLDAMTRNTRLGEGGIGSIDAVPDEARNVQPSQLGFIDPIKTSESFRVGIDSRLATTARKGEDNKLYIPVRDIKSNKIVYKSPQDIVDDVLAFPNELNKDKPYIAAMVGGQTKFVPRESVRYELPHMENAFSPLSNMIPGKSALKGQRMSMGSRYLAQALPLMEREAPLFQSGMPGLHMQKSFEDHYGKFLGAVRAEGPGIVKKVTPNGIVVQQSDGEKRTYPLYNNFPYARKTFLHNEPMVKVGDRVSPDQLLAKSNFTDDNGTAALGTNARVAFIPFRGANYEDAAVITDSYAKKLTSEHMYQSDQEWQPNIRKGLKPFVSLFPTEYTKQQLSSMDNHGVVKPGTTVHYGDPMVLVAEEKERTHSQIHRGRKPTYTNNTVIWDHHAPGLVTDVAHTAKGVSVAVKSYNRMEVGDKLSNRFGGKGVVAEIVPDDQMPHDEDGKPYDIALNPLGMISRINPVQVAEMVLGKIAKKTGQPYKIEDFSGIDDMVQFVRDEMKKHDVSDTETIIDPNTGRRIPNVLTGYQYLLKLHHTSECFDDKTEVLTARGWLTWVNVTENDELATVENQQLLYERPLKLICDDYSGPLYCFSGRYIDYAVTPNHRFLTRNVYNDSLFNFRLASELHGKRFCVPQFGFTPDSGTDFESIQIGTESISSEDYAELIGWWVSEGYAKVTPRRACVVIYQSRSANPDKFVRIEALAARLPFNWHYYRVKGEYFGVIISSRDLAIHLKELGTYSFNKRLPRRILDGTTKLRRITYEAMMAGDGSVSMSYTGPTARYTTTSKGLADDFQELCIRLGRGVVLQPPYIRKETSFLPAWNCGVALTRTDAQVDGDRNRRGFSVRQYTGKIYCAEMRTGLLYVRRNGKPMLSGNSKGQGRGIGGYTSENVPAKGKGGGSKRIALLETNALLSHGGTEVLRDAHLIRGQKNDDYWQMFMSGFRPIDPDVPLVYRKFVDSLKASGINVVRNGRQLHVMALTDKDVKQLAGDRNLSNVDTVDWKEGLRPRQGGLFDPALTGGHAGSRWAAIKLHEPMPNPAFEEPIRRMLGLTQKRFEQIVIGNDSLEGFGSGPKAIQSALQNINLDKAITQAETEVKGSKRTLRDEAMRKLQFLKHTKRLGIHPSEWILSRVPVLPPVYRPVSVMQNTGNQLVSDANYLYKELFDANDALSELHGRVSDLSAERRNVYNAFKGVVGLGDPIQPKNQERQVKGILRQVFGSSPKFGMLQRQLLGASVEMVGRAVITPNPDLDMDQVGLPEAKAWDVYKPFVIRRLVQKGVPRLEAARAFKDQTTMARLALQAEMSERPVVISRAPVLHRYGIMGALPQLVKGDVMQLPPLITAGYGADFDGDTMNYHVPATEEAKKEVLAKLLPSKNLLSAADFGAHYLPRHEYQGGLYHASTAKDEKRRPVVFRNKSDAIKAYREGRIALDTPIEIVQH